MNPPTRILIVEDQYFVAIDCEMQLRRGGFECVGFARSAAEAREVAARERPDLVIMDIRLAGGSDGVAAAIDIYECLNIRCIFASAHVDANVRQRAARAAPLGWLDKPYSSADLISVVRTAVERSLTSHVQPDSR